MDLRTWFLSIGVAALLAMMALMRSGRKQANAKILATGVVVDGVVLENKREGRITSIVYRFAPEGSQREIEATRRIDGIVGLAPGQRVAVCYLPAHPHVSLLVGFEGLHDGS